MGKYYVAGIPFDSENSLKHYGVKGMEWNKHKFGIDADDRYIKWLKNAGQNIGRFANNTAQNIARGATTAARTVGSAVNKGANFVGGTANQAKNVSNAANQAGKAIGTAANNAGRWAGQRANNIGRAASNVAQNIKDFVDYDITGQGYGRDLKEVEKDIAANPNSHGYNGGTGYVHPATGEVYVPKNSTDALNYFRNTAAEMQNNSLFGKVGQTAQNVGNTVGQAAQNVGNTVGQAAQNVSDWYTGQPNADRAESIDRQVQNYERLGDEMYDRGMKAQGDRYHQMAAKLGSAADANQAKYDNAPRQQLNSAIQNVENAVSGAANAAGDWAKGAAEKVADVAVWPATRDGVANAVKNVGDWAGRAAQNVGSAADKAAEGAKGAINSAGKWVSNAAGSAKNAAGKAASDAVSGAKGFINSAGKWVNNAASNVGNAAKNAGAAVSGAVQNAGNAVTDAAEQARGGIGGFFDRVGNTVGNAAQSVGDWAGNAAKDVGNAVGGAANAVGDWFTGGDKGEQAAQLRDQAQRMQAYGDQLVDEGHRGFEEAWDKETPGMMFRNDNRGDPDSSAYGAKARDDSRMIFDNALATRRRGYDAQDEASDLRNRSRQLQDEYDAAPRQQLAAGANAVGNAISGVARGVADTVSGVPGAVSDWVGGAVSNAAGQVGDWARNAAGNVGNWAGQAAQNVGSAAGQAGQWLGNAAQGAYQFLDDIRNADTNAKIQVATQQMADNYKQYLQDHPENPASPRHAEWAQAEQERLREQLSNDPQLRAYYEQYMRHSAIDEKPEGVSDAFWAKFTADGGTREDYERDWR